MKTRKLIYTIAACLIALFSSCTQEEQLNGQGENENVNFSLKLPSTFIATRAEIQIPAEYKMRSIVEVWSTDNVPVLKYREEKSLETGMTPDFNFQLQAGDYTCLFWTDFIRQDAETEMITTEEGISYEHFADAFYDTGSLKTIMVKTDVGIAAFDTDACDAYYGCVELKKNTDGISQEVTLKRPFAKLVIKENDANQFETLTAMRVQMDVPAGFNVQSGEPLSNTVTLNAEKSEFVTNENGQVLCSNYVFTPSAGTFNMNAISFSFSLGSTRLNREIPSGNITLGRNQLYNVAGAIIGEGDFEPEEPSELPKVGDFFYQNGTYSSAYTYSVSNPCIGVVFAVADGDASGDVATNYPGTSLSEVKGWVIAAYDAATSVAVATSEAPEVPAAVCKGSGDIQGFQNTAALKAAANAADFPALQAVLTYGNSVAAPASTSGWYWGGDEQYRVLTGVYAVKGEDDKTNPTLAVGKAFKTLEENNAGTLIGTEGVRRYWCSNFLSDGGTFFICCFDPQNSDYGAVEDSWFKNTASYTVRAILTF